MLKKSELIKSEELLLKKCVEHIQSLPNVKAIVNQISSLSDVDEVNGILTISSSISSASYVYIVQQNLNDNTFKLVVSNIKKIKKSLSIKLL